MRRNQDSKISRCRCSLVRPKKFRLAKLAWASCRVGLARSLLPLSAVVNIPHTALRTNTQTSGLAPNCPHCCACATESSASGSPLDADATTTITRPVVCLIRHRMYAFGHHLPLLHSTPAPPPARAAATMLQSRTPSTHHESPIALVELPLYSSAPITLR